MGDEDLTSAAHRPLKSSAFQYPPRFALRRRVSANVIRTEINPKNMNEPKAVDGNKNPIDPKYGVFPILKEVLYGKLSVVGTGFYLTRYGMFITAKHVIDNLVDWKKKKIGVGFACHYPNETEVHLRRIIFATLLDNFDLAICQADNYMEKVPEKPLMNMRPGLSTKIPSPGESLVTFAYPENKILDFNQKENIPTIKGDFYEGKLLRYVLESENPAIPYPHFETSIKLKSGSSGGPVFCGGKIIGVNCRGWDFQEDNENGNLSYIVPVSHLVSVEVELKQLPNPSWERNQIKIEKEKYSIKELADYGHIILEN